MCDYSVNSTGVAWQSVTQTLLYGTQEWGMKLMSYQDPRFIVIVAKIPPRNEQRHQSTLPSQSRPSDWYKHSRYEEEILFSNQLT